MLVASRIIPIKSSYDDLQTDRDNTTSSTSHSRSERQSRDKMIQPMSFNLEVSGYANNSSIFFLLSIFICTSMTLRCISF